MDKERQVWFENELKFYKQQHEKNPNDPFAIYLIGGVHVNLGEHIDALNKYREFIEKTKHYTPLELKAKKLTAFVNQAAKVISGLEEKLQQEKL
jgi:hypothetical protein